MSHPGSHLGSHPAFLRIDHRPWDAPARRWTWRQSWRDLLFAHWPVAAETIRPFVPEALEVQEFDGASWIGVVPFRMTSVMRRGLPDMPYLSAFPELNVRTYVERDGKPGVWFFSLDAANALAVWAARRFFHLPYFRSDIRIEASSDGIEYTARRRGGAPAAEFHARYKPVSAIYEAAPGGLDHWLTERYCLYAAAPNGRLYRCDVHHLPWPLQRAEAVIDVNTVSQANNGIELQGPPSVLHFSQRLDVAVWPVELVV